MEKETVLITGANSGIGKELALLYAKKGACLILTTRSKESADQVKSFLKDKYKECDIKVLLLDLTAFSSISNFLSEIKKLNVKINTAVFNAGIHKPFSSKLTADGIELHYQVNFLAYVILLNNLHDQNVFVPHAKVTYISSNAHKLMSKPWIKFNKYIYDYALSKLCATAYFLHYSQIYPGLNIKIIHPGLVDTSINRYKSDFLLGTYRLFRTYLSAKKAAATILEVINQKSAHIYWEEGNPAAVDIHCRKYSFVLNLWNDTLKKVKDFLPSNRQTKLSLSSNFASTYVGMSAEIQKPKSIASIQALIRTACENKLTVKTVGARHSYNDGFDSKQLSLSLTNLAKIKKIDKKNLSVTCQGGITINKLVSELHKKGLTLPFSGDYGEQTIAGAISAGTHGYCKTGGSLSELVTKITLVDGKGEIHTISEESELKIFRLSLGMLGTICELELKVIPINKYCEYSIETIHKDLIFNDIVQSVNSGDHIRYLLNPYDPNYFILMKLDEHSIDLLREKNIRKKIHFSITEKRHSSDVGIGTKLCRWLIRRNRIIKFLLHKASLNLHKKYYFMFDTGVFINDGIGNNRLKLFKTIYKAMKKNKEFDMEIGVEVKQFEKFYTFFVSTLKAYQNNDPNFEAFLSIRYLGHSDKVLLAANYSADIVFNDIFVYKDCPRSIEFLHTIELFALQQCKAKMHWGKMITTTYPFVLQNYDQKTIKTFIKYKKKYDPENVFSNNYTKRLFGL